MSRKTVRKAIEAPEAAFAYERGKFGANPAMCGFCFAINVNCWRIHASRLNELYRWIH
jgi:hypothetical protein